MQQCQQAAAVLQQCSHEFNGSLMHLHAFVALQLRSLDISAQTAVTLIDQVVYNLVQPGTTETCKLRLLLRWVLLTSNAEGAGHSFQRSHASRIKPSCNCFLHAPCPVTVRPHSAIHQLDVGFFTNGDDLISDLSSL